MSELVESGSDEIEIAPKEYEIQTAVIEIASKRMNEISNQNLLLEANLVVCQNNLRIQIQTTRDLESELEMYRSNSDERVESKEEEKNKMEEQLLEMTSKYEVVNQERSDLINKIESGYKKQIKDLQSKIKKLEELNGNVNGN